MGGTNCESIVEFQKEATRYSRSPVTSKDEARLLQFELLPEKSNIIWIDKIGMRIFCTANGGFGFTHNREAVRRLFGREEGIVLLEKEI